MIVGRPPEQVFVRAATSAKARGARSCATCGSARSAPSRLTLRAGEMVGLVGLRGAGQEQVGRALFGLAAIDAGSVELAGTAPDLARPAAAMRTASASSPATAPARAWPCR